MRKNFTDPTVGVKSGGMNLLLLGQWTNQIGLPLQTLSMSGYPSGIYRSNENRENITVREFYSAEVYCRHAITHTFSRDGKQHKSRKHKSYFFIHLSIPDTQQNTKYRVDIQKRQFLGHFFKM